MARVKRGVNVRARHKKILKMAKGYRGRGKSCFRVAKEKVEKGLEHAYRDRKDLKGNMRRLWIVRINAACRELGVKYNTFIHSLIEKGIEINRKMLSEMAIRAPGAFENLVKTVVN
jgi:large subunit ribosomal protein L20